MISPSLRLRLARVVGAATRCRRLGVQCLSSSSDSSSTVAAFDRKVKRMQRDAAARAHKVWDQTTPKDDRIYYDYFREEIARRLVDRLDDIKRDEGFPLALDIGSGPGYIHRAICMDDAIEGVGGIGGVRKLVQLDSSSGMLFRDEGVKFEGQERCDTYQMEGDEEATLPFPDGTFDLVISSTAMHWVNNLPGLFKEVSRVLKPDGCFMFAMIGGTTLPELRTAMVMAELEREGGVSPHVGPFVEITDIGSLLQRAKFALPTIDVDTVHITYPDAFVLMEHLQRMGENNAGLRRRERTPRDTFLAAACIYDELYGVELTDDDSNDAGQALNKEVEASIQVIFAIGWTPDASQQKPKARGSATHKIGEVVVDKSGGNSDTKT